MANLRADGVIRAGCMHLRCGFGKLNGHATQISTARANCADDMERIITT
jgi:hypothetical protein